MNRSARLALLGLTACSDAAVTKFNTPPTAEITSHADGDAVREGYPETLRGVVGDPNHPMDTLLVTWLVDGVPECADRTPDATGLVSCEVPIAVDGGEVVLEVRDPEGASASDRLTFLVTPTAAPEVDLIEPVSTGVYYSDLLTSLQAQVSDAEDAPSELTVVWESSLDGVLTGAFDTPDSEGLLLGAAPLSAGEHFLTVTVTDLTGKEGRDSTTISVGPPNTAPDCAITAPPEGDIVASGATVVLEGTASDPDVPADWLTAQWSSDKDGVLGGSPPASDGSVGLAIDSLSADTHRISLTVTDELGATCTAAQFLTVGLPPTLSVVSPADGAVVNEGSEVVFEATVADTEDAPQDLSITWTSSIDGVLSTDPPSAGGTSTFARSDLSTGMHTLTVTLEDRHGQTDEASRTFTVNALPTAATVTLDPSPATTVDDLVATASGSTDPDASGTVTYTWAWLVDGAPSSASTTATFAAADTAKHHTYTVEVTPTDGTGSGPTTTASVTVDNSAPVLSGPSLSPSSASRGDTLTCTASATDPDPSDSPTITYTWSDGSTGTTLDLSGFSRGDTVSCTALADDADGGTDTASASLVLSNSAPTVSGLTVLPSAPTTNSTLTASATTSDADGDSLTTTWDWYVNGTLVQSGSSSSLDGATHFDKSDSVYVTVGVDDGTDTTSDTSSPVTIQNTAPTAPTVIIDPELPLPDELLLCGVDVDSTDDDGDPITYTIDWTADSIPYTATSTTTLTDDTVPGSTTVSKEEWTCTVTPSDGTDTGPSGSDTVTPCPAVLDFDGVGDVVTLPTVTGHTVPLTMEAWVRVDTTPATTIPLVSTTCGGLNISPTEVNVGLIDSCLGASSGCKAGWNNVSTWVASNDPGGDGGFLYTSWTGDWQHVAVTIDSSKEARLYIDGSFHSQKTLSRDGCISSIVQGRIGRSSSSTGLDGQIGAVRLNTGLTYTGTFTPAYPLASSGNTVLLYGLQGDMDSSTLTDETGNGYTGTISNATWATGGPECE